MVREIIEIAAGIALYLLGFWAGAMLTRATREIVEREVPRVVTTEKVVEVEKPVLVQVPVAPARPPVSGNGGSLPIMGTGTRNIIADPNQREQLEHIQGLISTTPEA